MIAGSSASLMNLLDSVHDTISLIVILAHNGVIRDKFETMGVETLVCPFFYLWDKPKKLKTIVHHPLKSTFYHSLSDNKKCAKYVKKQLKGRHIDIVHLNSSITTVGCDIAKALNARHVWHIRDFLDLDLDITSYIGFKILSKLINGTDVRICILNAVALAIA